jgi:hypothetical protein
MIMTMVTNLSMTGDLSSTFKSLSYDDSLSNSSRFRPDREMFKIRSSMDLNPFKPIRRMSKDNVDIDALGYLFNDVGPSRYGDDDHDVAVCPTDLIEKNREVPPTASVSVTRQASFDKDKPPRPSLRYIAKTR